MRIENGGFIRVPKPNSRLRLNTILDKYEDVKKIMGKYTTRDRPLHFENPIVPYKTHDVLAEDEQRTSFLATLKNRNSQVAGSEVKVSPRCQKEWINDDIKASPLFHVTRSQLQGSKQAFDAFDHSGRVVVKARPSPPKLNPSPGKLTEEEAQEKFKYKLMPNPTNLSLAV